MISSRPVRTGAIFEEELAAVAVSRRAKLEETEAVKADRADPEQTPNRLGGLNHWIAYKERGFGQHLTPAGVGFEPSFFMLF